MTEPVHGWRYPCAEEFANKSYTHRLYWWSKIYGKNEILIKVPPPPELLEDARIMVAKARLLGITVRGWDDN